MSLSEPHTTVSFSCIGIFILHTLLYGIAYRCMLVHYTMGLTELYCTSVHLEAYATQIQTQLQCDFIVQVCVYAWTDHFS